MLNSISFQQEEEYEYEEEEVPYKEVLEEEDPKAIKELIDLIKKLGGIEQLEKQFNLQDDSSKSSVQAPTTQPKISKSLYEKVLNSASARSFPLNNRYTYTQRNNTQGSSSSAESIKNNAANKYSSVIRNSRPGPQNDGIDKLPEYEGLLRERPQYVTINRGTQSTSKRTNVDVDDEDEDEENSEEVADEEKDTNYTRRTQVIKSTPQYVSIQRRRPTTTARTPGEEDDVEDIVEEKENEGPVLEGTTAKQYNILDRRRIPQQNTDFTTPSSAINRYERPLTLLKLCLTT